MKMVGVKTADLVGAALDWAVAQADGDERVSIWGKSMWTEDGPQAGHGYCGKTYSPSTDWAQGGALIESFMRESGVFCDGLWHHSGAFKCSFEDGGAVSAGDTPLIAAMRAIVAAKLGDTVSVPAELLTSS